jgi:osmotically-inducible protein OsmY
LAINDASPATKWGIIEFREAEMFTLDVPSLPMLQHTTSPVAVCERAESELRRNAYVALKNISCEYRDGVLTLHGCLPTYYMKQLAQEAVARVEGVARVENRIEVVSAPTRAMYT